MLIHIAVVLLGDISQMRESGFGWLHTFAVVLLFSNPLGHLGAGRSVVLCICGGKWGCTGECEELLELAEGAGRGDIGG